jgi:hypothetical protein
MIAKGLLDSIAALPGNWHDSGNLSPAAIYRMHDLAAQHFPKGLTASAETGCGKSTLLLSHMSAKHFTFTLEVGDSLNKVRNSSLFNPKTVHVIPGPSQVTLRHFEWKIRIDFALIDGAHGYPFPELDYYFLYSQLNPGAILVIDDIHIPTVTNMYKFLRDDAMYRLIALEGYTAFFQRTDAPTHNPLGDSWWTQGYNQKHFPHKDWLEPVLGEKWWLK